jgi:hypothetical protein
MSTNNEEFCEEKQFPTEQEHIEALHKIIDKFNHDFARWMSGTNMAANFNWSYENKVKKLVISDVSKIIYSKPPSNILEKMGVKLHNEEV